MKNRVIVAILISAAFVLGAWQARPASAGRLVELGYSSTSHGHFFLVKDTASTGCWFVGNIGNSGNAGVTAIAPPEACK